MTKEPKDRTIIHFLCGPIMAVVEEVGDSPIEITLAVIENEDHCGTGIIFQDGTRWITGPFYPRNLIAAWRGTEILRRLDIIKNNDLFAALEAGGRSDSPSYFARPIIYKIGQKVYQEVMALPVPEEIIRAILDNQKAKNPPDTWPIIGEVRVGTVTWRQEFADAGIQHPDEIDAKKRQREKTLARFEPLIQAYASYRHCLRHCNVMDYVDASLLSALELLENVKHYPDEVIVALAGYFGDQVFQDPGSMTVTSMMSQDVKDHAKKKSLQASALWLAENCVNIVGEKPWWVPKFLWTWAPFPTFVYSIEEAKKLLEELTEEMLQSHKAKKAEAA